MKTLYILFFFSVYCSGQNYTYNVVVTKSKNVYHAGIKIKPGDKLLLNGLLVHKPGNDFFRKNKLKLKKDSRIELKYIHNGNEINKVWTYYDFVGVPTKAVKLDYNVITRSPLNEIILTYNCSFEIPDAYFNLFSFMPGKRELITMDCLKKYFSNSVYWLTNKDKLVLPADTDFKKIVFSSKNKTIGFVINNNTISILSELIETGDYSIQLIGNNNNAVLVKKNIRIVCLEKEVKFYKYSQYLSLEETTDIICYEYFDDTLKKEKIYESLVASVNRQIKEYYEKPKEN